MKKHIYIFIQLFILIGTLCSEENPLFLIYENGLYGYIDVTGKVIIEPKFKSAGDFSEGLAPVRENGYYGFIDVSGNYVINPEYDYAEKFINGYAIVNTEDGANFINKSGKKLLQFTYRNLQQFSQNRAHIYTQSGKWGVIDDTGNLIIDTLYEEVYPFFEGIACVKDYSNQWAAIDSSGEVIVPHGQYIRIDNFINGIARVIWYLDNNFKNEEYISVGYIDKKGKLLYSKLYAIGFNTSEYASIDSTFMVTEYSYKMSEDNRGAEIGEELYSGIMNFEGDLILKKPRGFEIKFMQDRFYLKDSNDRYFAIDKYGNIDPYPGFFDEKGNKFPYTFAGEKNPQKERLFGLIDTSLNYIIEPYFEFVHHSGINNGYFIYRKYLRDENDNYLPIGDGTHISRWGIASTDGKIISGPEFEYIDDNGFTSSLMLLTKNGIPSYINRTGDIIWQKKKKENEISQLNIDYQLRSNYSLSPYNQNCITGKTDALEDIEYDDDKFLLLLNKNEKETFNGKYEGISLYIINAKDISIQAPSVDGALYLVYQALDAHGNWRNIETFPSSFCGQSYHAITIHAGHYYKFSSPLYNGGFKTKIRAVLTISRDENNEKKVYSNEMIGSINPAQFWRSFIWGYRENSLLER